MDLTEQYIIMCEQAEEVQLNIEVTQTMAYAQKWVGSVGQDKETVYSSHMGDESYRYDKDVWAVKDRQKLSPTRWIERLVWLPSQDQLQAMVVDQQGVLQLAVINGSYSIYVDDTTYWSKSFEQAWLKLVMMKQYRKMWKEETKTWLKIL